MLHKGRDRNKWCDFQSITATLLKIVRTLRTIWRTKFGEVISLYKSQDKKQADKIQADMNNT